MYDPVIKDGKLARLSVSQLQKYLACPSQWWYKYVGGLPEPSVKAFEEGKAGHKVMEDWALGELSKPDWDIDAVVKLLPTLNELAVPEKSLTLLSLAGIPFQGSIDLYDGEDIYDYKFQSRIQRFAEPNPQTWGYLEELRRLHPGRQRYRFHYILISKKGAKPVKQTFEFSGDEIEENWLAYTPVVEEMKLAVEKRVADVAKNTDNCYKYGQPCPFIGVCDRNTMSFLDKINAAKAAVELPDIDEPTEAQKQASLDELKQSIRPPEILEREYDGYQSNLKKLASLAIKTVEVRHTVTLDIKRDGVFSASIGIGFAADCQAGDEDRVRKELSSKILDAIKNEAERYKKT